VSPSGERFELVSNKLWTGAHELAPGSIRSIGRPAGEKPESLAPVWATACRRTAQTASFRRFVTLYGPPKTAEFQLSADYGSKWKKNPFVKYKLLVNGTVLASQKITGAAFTVLRPPLVPAAVAAAFRDGPNQIEVRVERKKAPKKLTKCNTKDRERRLSVQFVLAGTYEADLALAEPAPADEYKKAGESNAVFVILTLRNKGPATIPGGVFHAEICCPNDFIFYGAATNPGSGPQAAGEPFTTCEARDDGRINKMATIDCAIGRWRAGGAASLGFGIVTRFQSTEFSEASTNIGWRISSAMHDPLLENNNRHVAIVYCETKSTKPECQNAG
jgi:hypothetical protein